MTEVINVQYILIYNLYGTCGVLSVAGSHGLTHRIRVGNRGTPAPPGPPAGRRPPPPQCADSRIASESAIGENPSGRPLAGSQAPRAPLRPPPPPARARAAGTPNHSRLGETASESVRAPACRRGACTAARGSKLRNEQAQTCQ
jgi:hypothetical protein